MSGRFDHWLFAPVSGRRIAGFRVVFASYLLIYFGSMWPHVELLFSNRGVYTPYLLPDYAPAPLIAQLLFATMLAAALALLLGYRSELSARALLALFLYHYFLQLAVKQSAFDRLIAIDLAVLGLADSGRVWGLDARRGGAAPCAWPERMIAFQTLALYFGSGFWKLFNPAWHTGALLRSTLLGMWASPLAFAIVRQDFSERSWACFSWAVIAFELSLAALLSIRRVRPLGLSFGIAFHAFNTIVLVVPEFWVAATAYPVFVAESTLERFDAGLARRMRSLGARLPGGRLRPTV